MLPYSWEMMFFGLSLDSVLSRRQEFGTLIRFPRTLSLVSPYSRSMMIMLWWYLYGVVSDRHVYSLFVPLPPPVLIDLSRKKTFRWKRVLPNFVSQCCVHQVLLTVPKHHDSYSTYHKSDVTSRALSSPFVSWPKCWILPRPIHPKWNQCPH